MGAGRLTQMIFIAMNYNAGILTYAFLLLDGIQGISIVSEHEPSLRYA